MTLRDASSEALMCPQNVAYMARLANCNSTVLRPLKSKIGGAVEHGPVKKYYFDPNNAAERQMFYEQ